MMIKKKAIQKIILFMGDHARHVCPVVRVIAPARMAGLEVFQGNERINGKFKLHLDQIADADLVIIQRDFPADFEAYERVVREARVSGKQILYDIDDLLIDLPEDHPDAARYIPGRFSVLRAIAEADAVTVASATLRSNLQQFNPNIHVLPNYLLDEIWGGIYPFQLRKEWPLTIGYMGGHSHRPDLDMLEPVFRKILDRYGEKIRLQLWGIKPPPSLADDPRVDATHLEYSDYDQFSSYLAKQSSDIFIAPLKDSQFNRSKSWLKFLEYSALGVSGVYSDLEPYREIVQHGKTGFLASTLNEWHEYLTALIEDTSLRRTIGARAFQDVRENYMLSDHVQRWTEVYTQVVDGRQGERGRAFLENSLQLASRWQGEVDADRAKNEKELISAREEAQFRSETIQAQQEELARIQKAFNDLTVQHNEVNIALTHFESFATEQSLKIEAIETQLTEARRLNQLIPDMQSQLKEKDRRIDDLQDQLHAKNDLITDQQSRLRTKDDLIESQESRIGAQEQVIAEQDTVLTAHEEQRVRLQAQASVYKTSHFLLLATRIRHRWTGFWMGIQRRFGRRRMLPLFDPEWYLNQWPDVAQASVDPYSHYLQWGWREGRNPSPYFDVIWYLRTYPDVLEAGIEPLGHYVRYGRWENRRPHPDLPKDFFPVRQSPWLPIQHRPDAGTRGWRRKVAFRWKLLRLRLALRSGRLAVPALFDADWYLAQWPDVAESKIQPYLHYLMLGWMDGRDPHPNFNARRYMENNPDVRDAGIEPFEHFCTYGWLEGRNPRPEIGTTTYMLGHRQDPYFGLASILSGEEVQLPTQVAPSPPPQKVVSTLQTEAGRLVSTQDPGSAFARRETLATYEPEQLIPLDAPPVKLIAFYLPQFHPIPENDDFWGQGFTEWTNVAKARPLFKGHYQPRLPGVLGFYDLRVVDVLRQQAEMARVHGIYGFCFHHYWFNGKRVLERPVDQFLKHPEIDIQFCLNWANENWTRRWDGQDQDVLLRQEHSPEDDLAFIADTIRLLRDPRYIQIEGKPLLLLYKPLLLPEPRETANRWREYVKTQGFEGLFLVAAQTSELLDPDEVGFDALVEYPPLKALPESRTNRFTSIGEFQGQIFDYDDLAQLYDDGQAHPNIFRGVTPGWDNTPRRGPTSTIFHGSTPESYQRWLTSAIESTILHKPEAKRFLFINAWNEWAESAYLEPDREHGYAYLNATSRALVSESEREPKLLFVGHDGARAGSQIVLLELLRWLRAHTHYDLRLILGRGGPLEEDYRAVAPTLVIDDILDQPEQEIRARLMGFCGQEVDLIYANTGVSGWILPHLDFLDAPVLAHIHELQMSIEKFVGEDVFEFLKRHSDHFIAVSPPVQSNLMARYGIDAEIIDLVYPFLREGEVYVDERSAYRERLGLDPDTKIIYGCGSVDWRKGPDLFVEVAAALKERGLDDFHFYWIGGDAGEYKELPNRIHKLGLNEFVSFLGEKDNPREYFAVGDIFLLPSREDPFPLVVLEAAEQGLPTVCFADAGGMPGFVEGEGEQAGFVIRYEDVQAMADKVEVLLKDEGLRSDMGKRAREKFKRLHTVDIGAPKILRSIRKAGGIKPKVSVIVPTYNHGEYLPQRIDSIVNQTYRDYEILILDDASTDNTPSILSEIERCLEVQIEVNEKNSGSTFTQWTRGIDQARGELIWIAEDDDYCEPTLLEALVPYFHDLDVKLAYCQSYAVDENGERLFSYLEYTKDLSTTRWDKHYTANVDEELDAGLAIRNTIPNASAVVFRKLNIDEWEKEWTGKHLAGDWALYLFALQNGKIAFHNESLNFHRRHENTNIFRTRHERQRFIEVVNVQKMIVTSFKLSFETRSKMRQEAIAIFNDTYPDASLSEFEMSYNAITGGLLTDMAVSKWTNNSETEDALFHKLKGIDDDKWYQIVLQSLERNIVDGVQLPGFPSVEIQTNTVGRSGEAALFQAFQFYKLIKRQAAANGILFGEDARICDFGCGWGRIARFFLKDLQSSQIIGLDSSEALIRECERTFIGGEFQIVPYQPPYRNIADESFDLIYAYSVFSHLSPTLTTRVIEEFGRITKAGGAIVLTSRGKAFMTYCEALRLTTEPLGSSYQELLRDCFTDLEQNLASYDRGLAQFYECGGGGILPTDVYGEAAYPPEFFRREFQQVFDIVAVEPEDPRKDLDQVTIVLRRR